MSILLRSGRIFQQFIVDVYVKLETSRLDYFRLHQDVIRAELYSGIVDSMVSGQERGNTIGRRLVLPPTFIGGLRDMRRRYMDAMALVQRYGKPDIFLTITCNPSWPEIKAELLPHEEAQNRPDLIARVFRAKLEELKEDLFKRHVLGHVVAYVYVVEFQKRGLPHAHFLLIMRADSRITSPEQYDECVSAEIPTKEMGKHLRAAVKRHMMHGPCGEKKPTNVCMRRNTGKCKNHYPKEFCETTNQASDGYPIYMRRNNGEKLRVRGHDLDNRWVVPYNPYLLAKYDCHINVEICSTIKAVKYLYKYIYKGHDQVSFQLQLESSESANDEISTFQLGRWIAPPEAAWRIFGFILNEISPAVISLQLHLPDSQTVTFRQNSLLRNVISNPCVKKTMLTEYFAMNATDPNARTLYYRQFPEQYAWYINDKYWTSRKRGKAIGRIVSVSPSEGERYFLRLLLNNVKGATSFECLRFVDGKYYDTFREAALALGLLEADNSAQICMDEAAKFQMPSSLRRLFAIILVYCNPLNTEALWKEFEVHMIEDFIAISGTSHDQAVSRAITNLAEHLQSMGKSIKDYKLPSVVAANYRPNLFKEIQEELEVVTPADDLASIRLLNDNQRIAFNAIVECVISEKDGCFFVDGPGGTGKTFLYRALLAHIRSQGYIAIATASSGVAASILPGGRTAHSRFKIPLSIDDGIGCNVPKQGGLAKLLKTARLIVWDEAPMVRKQAIEAVDNMLRDICSCDLLFGGKVIIFGGDFRQVLLVVLRSNVQQTIDVCLLRSYLWPRLQKYSLSNNMRAQYDPEFSAFLLRVGDATEPNTCKDEIAIPKAMLVQQSKGLLGLIECTFPGIEDTYSTFEHFENRAILAPKHEVVDEINALIIDKFHGDEVVYRSWDTAIESNHHHFQEDFCNTLTPNGFPPHLLRLKVGCPVMLLRNLDPSRGMCNGTRLICKAFGKNVISAVVASGTFKGNEILLPRILLLPLESEDIPFPFKRTQFPITLCFAMTINKAQGQTLDFVGVCLSRPVFGHGQLYVALSRARNADSVRVLVNTEMQETCIATTTRNVVYGEVLALAGKQ